MNFNDGFQVEMVIVPATIGQMDVFPGHVPTIAWVPISA